jgi:hypothetical protein
MKLALQLLSAVCFMSASAQVQVSQEPRHHKVFENQWVRILDVRIPPGDTSLFHKHSTPSVFLVLSNTRTGSEVKVEPQKMRLTPGNIWYESFADKPRIHRVWNADTSMFHTIDMELPATRHVAIDAPLDSTKFKLLFDEVPVRGYRVMLPAGADWKIPPRRAPMVLIALDEINGAVQVNEVAMHRKGDYLFIPADGRLELRSAKDSGRGAGKLAVSPAGHSFALFEIK